MIRIVLCAMVAFAAYIIFSGLVATFYASGIDVPHVELSSSVVIYALTAFAAFTAWIRLD